MVHAPYDHTTEQIEQVAVEVVDLIKSKLTKTGEVYACVGMVNGLISSLEIQNALFTRQNNSPKVVQ